MARHRPSGICVAAGLLQHDAVVAEVFDGPTEALQLTLLRQHYPLCHWRRSSRRPFLAAVNTTPSSRLKSACSSAISTFRRWREAIFTLSPVNHAQPSKRMHRFRDSKHLVPILTRVLVVPATHSMDDFAVLHRRPFQTHVAGTHDGLESNGQQGFLARSMQSLTCRK